MLVECLADKHPSSPPLTTWSFIWMHSDFFLIAATPVVKVFLMLVARLRDSWETPSRPAMELDRTAVPPTRFMNNELMIFLQETHRCRKPFGVIRPVMLGLTSCVRLTFGSPAGGSRHWWRQDSAWHSSASCRCRTLPSRCRDCGPAGNGWAFRSLGGKCDLVIKRGGCVRWIPRPLWADMRQWNVY